MKAIPALIHSSVHSLESTSIDVCYCVKQYVQCPHLLTNHFDNCCSLDILLACHFT